MKYSRIIVGLLLIAAMNMSYAMETGEIVKKEEPFPLLLLPEPIVKIICLPSSMQYKDILNWLPTTKALMRCNQYLNTLFAADVAKIRTMLDEANYYDKNSGLPLSLAIHNKDHTNIQWLIDHGANIDKMDYLYPAISKKDIISVRMLLINGSKIFSINERLGQALWENSFDIAALLVKYGADVNYQRVNPGKWFDGSTYLMNAVFFNKFNVVEFLLQHGADKNIKDNDGNSIDSYIEESSDRIEPKIIELLERY